MMNEIAYDVKKEKKKFIPAIRKAIEPCTACGLCIKNCVFHKYTIKDGRKIMREIKDFILSKNFSKKMSRKTKKYIWTCGICEHCNNSCPLPKDKQISKSALIIVVRTILVILGQAPFIIRFVRNHIFKDINNPVFKYVWPIAAKLIIGDWYSSKDPEHLKERRIIEKARRFPTKGAEVCLYGGCGHSWVAPDVVYQIITILEAAGVDFITIGNENFCCGMVYAMFGYLDLFIDQTNRDLEYYMNLRPRPKELLLHCPGCYTVHMFDMTRYGIELPFNQLEKMQNPMKIMHVTQYILKLIKEGKIELKNEVPITVAYNDSCSTGRRNELTSSPIYDEPREILASIPGVKVVKTDFDRENALCCGLFANKTYGYGLNLRGLIGKDGAYKTQKELFQNMLDKGTRTLITPCMGCSILFEDGARMLKPKLGEKINILEINELVNHSMGINVTKRHGFINDAVKISPPFIKLPALKLLPRIIRTHAFRDIFMLLKKLIPYMRNRKKR